MKISQERRWINYPKKRYENNNSWPMSIFGGNMFPNKQANQVRLYYTDRRAGRGCHAKRAGVSKLLYNITFVQLECNFSLRII